ncbi:MAG: two-component system, cell cycle sensor histidine kinase and response regulator CckA [Chloroflexota bacterium]|nr:two-component system, cell cycle sensor histidine kinase and response regulator CckA [Chloroflexota bacterium]
MRDLFGSNRGELNVLCFPADDQVLRKRVRDSLAKITEPNAKAARDALRGHLRIVYPRAEVRVRDPLAGFGEPTVYVFRDGGIASSLGSEAWHDESTAARLVTDDRGTYIDANDAAVELLGVTRDEIVGHPAGSFTKPDARIEDAAGLWELLTTSGRLHSLAIVTRPGGRDLRVEFTTVRDADGKGRHLTWLRPFG